MGAAINIGMNTMHPMRRLIALSEARTPKRPVDISGFAAAITAVMRKFVTKSGTTIRFNREWADAAQTAFRDAKAREMEPDDTAWDRELLSEVTEKIWQRGKDQLMHVKRNVEHAEQEYQRRAAERHERLDDPDFYIRSSDYLSGMNAMVRLAEELQIRPLSDPQSAKTIIAQCDRFIDDWENTLYGGDGGEQPMMDEEFVTVIERLLPLLLLLHSNAGR